MTQDQTPSLRFPEFRGAWAVKPLGELCEIATGKVDANAMVENGQYRFYTCAKNYYFIDDYAFDTDALLISGNGANVGYIHHYKGKFNAYQRTYVLDKFPENILFIKHYLDYNLHKRIFVEKKEGNTPYIVKSTLARD
ncbi:MAG: restriction endonuclease subunit S [Proteobacteria bacterium]|nr:restriction endonuclease subunit S [Pseudomonadota bacterium]